MSTPFFGEQFTFTNPDGSQIQVLGWGNQHYAVFEALDGHTIVKDPASGFYQYAELSADKNLLVPTGNVAGTVDPQALGLSPHIRIRRSAAKQAARSASALGRQKRRWEVRLEQKKRQRMATAQTRALAAPPPGATVGNYVGLCIMIDFPDIAGTIPRQQVNDYCNQVGYNGFGNNGSVLDYFNDVSDGKLTYTNVVTDYYTAAQNRSYYTDPSIAYGTRTRELILEALNNLVGQGFDFSSLSSDSGGFVYALNVFYAGPVVNNWSEGLWPHSWGLATPFQAAPGKKFSDYQITNVGSELTLGTFCHENGHMICDFPDLYDYGSESRGAGRYCLMAGGGSNKKNPAQVGAYLKNAAGWTTSITPITSGISGAVTAGKNDFYIYDKNGTEYFIIENRQKQGRDVSLTDAGLAIWHIDESGSNNNEQMTPAMHYECSIEQADNQFDLENNANSGDAEDLFGAPLAVSFGDGTSPNSRWWDGSSSGLEINQISAPAPTMTFNVGTVSGSSFPVYFQTRL